MNRLGIQDHSDQKTWLWIESVLDRVIDPVFSQLEWKARRNGIRFLRIKWPDVRWVPSRAREVLEAGPEKVILVYHPELYSGGSLFRGDYSRLINHLNRKKDGPRVVAALPRPLPARIFKKESVQNADAIIQFFHGLDLGLRKPRWIADPSAWNAASERGKSQQTVGGIPGTISRTGAKTQVDEFGIRLESQSEELFQFLLHFDQAF